MAYYCGECAVWAGSSDVNRYGERWCSYSRRYEKSNQETYGCRGFVYNGRAVVTAVCDVLHLPTSGLFAAWDQTKEAYLVPLHMDQLAAYSCLGPKLAARLKLSPRRETLAREMLHAFLLPAQRAADAGRYDAAAETYRRMLGWMEREV